MFNTSITCITDIYNYYLYITLAVGYAIFTKQIGQKICFSSNGDKRHEQMMNATRLALFMLLEHVETLAFLKVSIK